MELMSRLTHTEEDRQILRRTSQLVAVLLVVSLVVNGLIIAGKWDDMWKWLLPSSAVDAGGSVATVEEDEDERLADELYTEHRRWAQQRDHDEMVARQLEEQKQQALADELHALEAEQATQQATAEASKETAATPPSEPVVPIQ